MRRLMRPTTKGKTMRTNAMKAETISAMKARMSEAGWCGIDSIADACVDCENGADVADVLVNVIGIETGDTDVGPVAAWKLICEWADGGFADPAPF